MPTLFGLNTVELKNVMASIVEYYTEHPIEYSEDIEDTTDVVHSALERYVNTIADDRKQLAAAFFLGKIFGAAVGLNRGMLQVLERISRVIPATESNSNQES